MNYKTLFFAYSLVLLGLLIFSFGHHGWNHDRDGHYHDGDDRMVGSGEDIVMHEDMDEIIQEPSEGDVVEIVDVSEGKTETDVVVEVPPASSNEVICTNQMKQAEFCTMEYAPVCGLVEVQCITTPCYPVPQTFSNGCSACAQGNVVSYSAGECIVE